MKSILFALVSLTAVASAGPSIAATETARTHVRGDDLARQALDRADEDVVATQREWDRAVAGGHPIAAGTWATRHFEALQMRKVARSRVTATVALLRGSQKPARSSIARPPSAPGRY